MRGHATDLLFIMVTLALVTAGTRFGARVTASGPPAHNFTRSVIWPNQGLPDGSCGHRYRCLCAYYLVPEYLTSPSERNRPGWR